MVGEKLLVNPEEARYDGGDCFVSELIYVALRLVIKVEKVDTRGSYFTSNAGYRLVLVNATLAIIGSSNLGVVFFTLVYYS